MTQIAITQRLAYHQEIDETREELDIRWHELLKKAQLSPLVLSASGPSPKEYLEQYSITGVIFSGGNDLSSLSDCPLSKTRDKFEKGLLSEAILKNIPVLGVCRGAQLIADYFGSEFTTIKNHVRTNHNIKFCKSLKWLKDFSDKSVNSYHNYAIQNLSKELILSASTEDECIEAFEHTDHKIAGIMWHPERNNVFDNEELKFLKSFFDVNQ